MVNDMSSNWVNNQQLREFEQQVRKRAAEREQQQLMAALGDSPVEQPLFDPVDILAGGLMSLPRGLGATGLDMATDAATSGVMALSADSGYLPAIFAGKNARGANLGLMRQAMDALDNGVPREQVWKDTGWMRGPDGLMRFEIDDSMSMPGHSRTYGLADRETIKAGEPLTIQRQKAILHPNLSSAYPETKKIGAVLTPGVSGGAYNPDLNIISGGYESNGAANRSTLLHELQHAIQEREGFARGGSSKSLAWANSDNVHELLKVAKQTMAEWKPATYEQFWGKEVTTEGQRAYRQYLSEFNSKEQVAARWRAAQEGAPARIYKNLAGEAEARNVQTRMNFTPEQRREIPPWQTLDVPEDELIVRHGDGLMASIDKPWEDTLETYLGRTPDKLPYDLFNVPVGQNKVTVTQNPTPADYKGIDGPARYTEDNHGNRFIWPAYDSVHAHIEPAIQRRIGRPVNQNPLRQTPAEHRRAVYHALKAGKSVPPEVLAQYANDPVFREFIQ